MKDGIELIHDENSVRLLVEEALNTGKMDIYREQDNEELPAIGGCA